MGIEVRQVPHPAGFAESGEASLKAARERFLASMAGPPGPPPLGDAETADVVQALRKLGFTAGEAKRRVAVASSGRKVSSVEELLAAALRQGAP